MSSESGSCVIGLEIENEYVRWVCYDNRDGSFKTIVPILRTYKNRDDVKKLIDLGFQDGLPLTADQLPETVDRSEVLQPSELTENCYEFYGDEHHMYRYIFTKDNKWICRAPDFFDMDKLQDNF